MRSVGCRFWHRFWHSGNFLKDLGNIHKHFVDVAIVSPGGIYDHAPGAEEVEDRSILLKSLNASTKKEDRSDCRVIALADQMDLVADVDLRLATLWSLV